MIGFYDYTVILTYMSLASAGFGIMVSLSGLGHPYMGAFFLLFCGLCDAFDGKVARTKKDRTQQAMSYGIQIDSLSDLVAFGVLPAAIGLAMLHRSQFMINLGQRDGIPLHRGIEIALAAVLVLYMLAALIRLAYFNVTEEERAKTEGGVRKYYKGLPVTSAALIFPVILLLQFITPFDVTPLYFGFIVLVGLAFLSPISIKKPGLRGILVMVGIGAVEFILMLIGKFLI